VSEAAVAGLLVLLVLLALIAVRAADLLLAVVALGGYSFAMALVWAAIGAVDVAFTEAVVGAGVTMVFMLAALLRTSRRRSPVAVGIQQVALPVVLVVGFLLVALTTALPPWADPAAPAAVHVHDRTDIARSEFLAREIGYQYYTIMLPYRIHSASCNGYAVTRRGASSSGPAIQTVRTRGFRPSGTRSSPSTV